MLRHIWLETTTFGIGEDRADAETGLMWALEALTQRNQYYLKQRPNTVRLYKSGIVWEAPSQFSADVKEVQVLRKALGAAAKKGDIKEALEKIQAVLGGEHFCDIGVILELGAIDCDGLACWRAAELRQMGIPASPMMTSRQRPDGGTTYHALVRWPPFGDALGGNPFEATDEDPSLLLGMAQPERAADRQEEIRKNVERYDYIKRCQQRGVQPGDVRALDEHGLLEDVLGLRRNAPVSLEAELERILSGGRA